jgi:hypothetical protein
VRGQGYRARGQHLGARRIKVNNSQVPPVVTGLHFVNFVSPAPMQHYTPHQVSSSCISSPFGDFANRAVRRFPGDQI